MFHYICVFVTHFLDMTDKTPIISFSDADIINGEATVIYGLNMDVYPGDFVYIVGKVGTGKTSIIRTMIAENPLFKGHGEVCGYTLEDIRDKDIPYLRRKLGVVFQDFQLLMDRSVEENLLFVLRATGWKSEEEMKKRITDVLESVGMERKAHKMPHQLSGGEQQRIAIDKPSGIPSVPGLDGRKSILEKLEESGNHEEFHIVHRLDMDTSGIMIFAKNRKAATDLQKQFESRIISKTYEARLSYCPEGMDLKAGDTGTIRLPLSADYDERPRQKVDMTQGKESFTEYEVLSVNGNGTIDILFRPHTGRTHQLRVHSAHISGLGHPILGDMLYGGAASHRLHLHARSISFTHPATKERMMLESLPLNHFDSNK